MPAARTLVCAAALVLALVDGRPARADDDAKRDNAAKENAHPQGKIEVSGPKDYDERRESTVAKIVVGRDQIERFGDSTLEDVLKRLPGVTVTAQGGISLRGLGSGYTQVLLDGQPLPPGFSIESLSPDMIERIEILRSATAEFSTQAVAGTINIVLRKAASHLKRSVKLTVGQAGSRPQGKLDAELSEHAGTLAYTLTASIARTEFESDPLVEQVGRNAQGEVDSIIITPQPSHGTFDQVSLAPRLEWTLAPGNTLAWESFAQLALIRFFDHEAARTLLGPPPVYPTNDLDIPTHVANARSTLAWSRALAEGAKAESKLSFDYSRRHYEAGWQAYDEAGAHILDRNVHSIAVNDNITWTGKYTAPFVPQHALSFGWDAKYSRRAEDRVQRDITFDGNPPGLIDESYDARVRQLALYGQDDWEFAARASAYLGLRWEGLDTRSVGNVVSDVENRSSVFSPIAQVLWKLPGTEKDQVRAALARTYRAPTPFEIMPRRYIANNNTATSPDYQGNAELRPEIAWGLDLAYEHYFAGAGSVSISGYARRIDDVIVRELFNQAGVWITRPANDGRAESHGVELDAKLPLRTFFPRAPAIVLHANASRHWSRVDAIPGPDNRLVQQPELTANAGLDYEPSGLPFALGGNVTYTSGGVTRTASTTSVYRSRTRNLDLYALWKISPKMKLRITGSNLLGDDTLEVLDYFDTTGSLEQTTTTPGQRTVRALLEMQF